MSNGIDRSQILNQLKVILTPQEYQLCEGLNDAELSAKLREALSNNGNMGVGDSFEIGNNGIIPQPNPQQKLILPNFGVESSIPQLTTEQAQDIAMQNLWAINGSLAQALSEQNGERTADTSGLIAEEARGLYYLDKSRSPEGLTLKEYFEGIRNDLKAMLLITFPDLAERNINLEERLDSLDAEQIKMLQKAIISANTGKLNKNEVLRMFADSTQTVETITLTQDGNTHTETRVKINPPHSEGQDGERKISFEDIYKIERGIEFNPQNIRQYLIDGTVTYFQDPFENGVPDMQTLEKDLAYRQRLPQSYIKAFGQPYRTEYLSVLQNSDYDPTSAYGLSQVKLDGDLMPSTEGTEYVIPSRDITQGTDTRELNQAELKRFSANMLYNILNTTYNMLKGYYDGAWEQLKSGSVGTAAVQGFMQFGEMLSGQDLTVRSQMDNVEALLAKAAQLKNMDNNAFEQHFEELFNEISGTSFDPAAMQNFAQLSMKGLKTDTAEYDDAVKRAFGSNRTGDADSQFSILNPINSVVDIVAFLAGSEVLGSTKLFAQMGAKSFQLTTKAAARLGFDPASKGVQAGIRLLSSSPVSAGNLMTYTAITEIGGTAITNLAEKYGIVKPQGEYMSVMDPDRREDDDLVRILVDMTKQGTMGSVAPFIGAFATKTGEGLARTFSKGNPTAIQRSFSALSEAEGKTLNAQSLMKEYLSGLDVPAFTKAQEVISKSAGFLTEVAGFTGYSTLEHIAEGLLTGELDLDSLDLGEEFEGQLQGLATLKGVARFIQMKKSGAVARGVQDKAQTEMTEQLKNYDITDVGGQYRVLDKTSGKFETFKTPEEAISHLTRILFTPPPRITETTGERPVSTNNDENTRTFDEFKTNAQQNGTNYELVTDENGNRMAVSVSSEISAFGISRKKLNVTVFDKDGKIIEELKDVPEKEIKSKYPDFYTDNVTRETIDNSRAGTLYSGIPVESAQRPQHTGERTELDPFGLNEHFTPEELQIQGNSILETKDGKQVLNAKGSELVRRIALQIRERSLAHEPDIVDLMIKMGLGTKETLSHRSKGDQSLYDKIQNALIDDPSITVDKAIKLVMDGVGVRTVDGLGHFADDPEVQALLDKNDRQSAIQKAAELESEYIYKALEKYIDSVANGTAKVKITRISNYMGKDGIPYFTDTQLAKLKAYAASNGVALPVIERVQAFTERGDAEVYNKKASTKVRGSGYTALQMNFETPDGFVYEWQYRGTKLNEFAEGEHIPYDLRTNKDIIGTHTELTELYEPMKKLLSKENISEDLYEEYNHYLTAHYEYLREVELGFTDMKPPKLPKGLDARLRAENLELLHRTAEKIKDNPSKKEELMEEYNRELVQNTPENTTSTSYVRESRIRDLNRTIDRNEAEARLGGRKKDADNDQISRLIDICRNKNGQISDKMIAEVERLYAEGLSEAGIKELLKQVENGSYYSVAEKFRELKSEHPDKTADEIADMIIPNEAKFRELMSGLTMMDRPRFTEAEMNELQGLYNEYGDIIESLITTTRRFGSREIPVYTNEQIMTIAKSLKGNSELVKELVNSKKTDPTGKEIPKYKPNEITEILDVINQHPFPEQFGRFIKEQVLTDPQMEGKNIKEHLEKVLQNSADMLPADIAVINEICKAERTDELLDLYKNATTQKERDILTDMANKKPDQFRKYALGIFSMKAISHLPITKDISKRIEFIEKQEILQQFSEGDRANLLICSQSELENGIHYLERMQSINPDLTYAQKLEITKIEQMIKILNPDLDIDVKTMVDKGFIDDFYKLSNYVSQGFMGEPMSLRMFVISIDPKVDSEIFKKNVEYILKEQRTSLETNGQTTRFENIKNISNILKYNIDYEKRLEQVEKISSDSDVQEILLRTENISKPTIVEEVTTLKETLENMGFDIDNPMDISNFINRNPRLNLTDFNQYLNSVDMNKLTKLAPRMRAYTDSEIIRFMEYHYKEGRTEFSEEDLKISTDFTQFLMSKYVDAKGMDDILTAFPLTERNVGNLPDGWLKNIPENEHQNIQVKIQTHIDEFNNNVSKAENGESEYGRILINSAISRFQQKMSETLGKPVHVENLGAGSYGTGFKVSVDGSTDVVLKIFHKAEQSPNALHGKRIETQLGLFLNENSNKYAHMYFGRVAGARDNDGYLVTQYLAEGVSPILSQSGNKADVHSYDAIGTHNRIKLDINGQKREIDFDYGKVVVRDKDGKDIRFRLDNN